MQAFNPAKGILDTLLSRKILSQLAKEAQTQPEINIDSKLDNSSTPEPIKENPLDLSKDFVNKRLPDTIAPAKLLGHFSQYPQVSDILKPYVMEFINNAKKLAELKDSILQQQKIFNDMISGQKQQERELQGQLQSAAANIYSATREVDPNIDLIITALDNLFFVAAQRVYVQKSEQTMTPDAQVELLKALMSSINPQFASECIAKFDQALQKTVTVNESYERTMRVWPIPGGQQNQAKLKMAMLVEAIGEDIVGMLNDIHDLIVGALSTLIDIEHTVEEQTKDSSTNKKIIPMGNPSNVAPSKAASKVL